MTPQKRKVDAASPAESSDESPHKRARSESTVDTANKQYGNTHISHESSDHDAERSITLAKPSSLSQAAPDTQNEAAPLKELPQSWDEADAADKMLVKMKEDKSKKISWARIEQNWERSTGEKPGKSILQDRYRRLKDIMAQSEASGAVGRTVKSKVVEVPMEASDDVSTLPTHRVRPSSPVISGPSDESSDTIYTRPVTEAKPSNPAIGGPLDRSSPAISKRSRSTAISSETASAAPNDVATEEDLPQSWEQANAGDQLIVRMKTSRKAWAKIKETWQKLTGETLAEGAVQDRYKRIKDLVICPPTNGTHTYTHPVKTSTLDPASDQAVSQRAKPMLRTPRKGKAEAEPSEESLDESSDESSVESSDESSYETSKHSIMMARRKPRGAAEQQISASAFDGPSDETISKGTKTKAGLPSDGRVEAGSSDESDDVSKHSKTMAKSAKRPRVKSAIAANSGAQNTTETADDMVVEMRERGSTWVEISKAWTERTGLVHVPETLRKRYARIKDSSATKTKSIVQASSKRKVKATSPDEGLYESSAKRSKSTTQTPRVTETPIKRNMDRGKRKSSVKYTDSTTDEDELFAAPVEPVATASAKRNAGRAAKVNRSDPEWLVTNEKSPLAYEDLHAEFSNPKTYENFTKSDWQDLCETLPPTVPINPDGYSIPMTFFKYDPDFRRGIREFQEDLASGRLDPQWQADAAQAMEERARGEFDAHKENQFEAFWGQKQKLNHDALAGESTKIKLDTLIQNEIFKVGDYFSYSRVFGRGKNGVLVEKDCKIVKVDAKALTFAIPPGQRKYSRRMFESGTSEDTKPEAKATMAGGDEQPPTGVDSEPGAAQVGANTETNGDEAPEASEKGDGALLIKETAENGNLPDSSKTQAAELTLENKTDENDAAEAITPESTEAEANNKPQENKTHESTASEENNPNGASAQTNGGHSSTSALQEEDVLHSISNLQQLENKIVDIDGYFNSKDIATINAWKAFRGIRNNQDLGTLFEMREEFYVYKHPQIVKEAKRKR